MISVIIPVYNTGEYLKNALDSSAAQSYREVEFICIDDGSTDNSGEICDTYARKDTRFRVIHQKNAGAAAAKNAGLRIASGEYLAFLDSDDYLEPDAYEYMLSELVKSGADAIHCSHRDVFRNRVNDRLFIKEPQMFDGVTYLRRFTEDWTCSLLWNKLYKRELFEGVEFEEGHRIDDEFFTYQGFIRAKKVLYSPKVVYNYRKRISGAMNDPKGRKQVFLDTIDALNKRRIKIAADVPELKEIFDRHYLETVLRLSRNNSADEQCIVFLKDKLCEYYAEPVHAKIEWSLRWPLWKLRHDSIEKILSRREEKKPDPDPSQFFE